MVKTILYRGGMIGDLIIGMINKEILSDDPLNDEDSLCVGFKINPKCIKMKKFFRYSNIEKNEYYETVKDYDYVLSHDTDYCLQLKDVIQIVCSDESLLLKFSQRFKDLHKPHVHQEVIKAINSNNENFVVDYANNIKIWQDAFIFKNRFDIKNIGSKQFLDDVIQQFNVVNVDWANFVYDKWLESSRKL